MYTIQQRKAIYQLALLFLNGEMIPTNYLGHYNKSWATHHSGLCELIREASFDLKYTDLENYAIPLCNVPEFESKMPENAYEGLASFWWPKEDREIRKQVLQECIKMTENEDRTDI